MNRSTPLYAGEARGLEADAVWHELIRAEDMAGPDPWEWATPPGDPEAGLTAPGDVMAGLEEAHARARVLIADQYRMIAELLGDAERDPDPWVGPDPTLDAAWQDPRGRSVAEVRRDRRDLALRAAACDVAMRLRMSETTVRAKANTADTLMTRCPRVWGMFQGGAISEQNARIVASAAASLPDEAVVWEAFDAQVANSARVLAPGKLRVRVRVVRDRVHPESIDVRHTRAAEDRYVQVDDGDDAMSTMTVHGPTVDVHAAWSLIDTTARHLHGQQGESRTLAQLRADVAADVLAGRGAAGAEGIAPVVAITVPAMTLLGEDDRPATLEGYGPIDLAAAKRIAGSATSWIRVLTDPVTGAVLDMDRKTYRVPADLRRWVTTTHPTCIFPGCSRSARECDIDHRVDWQHGGTTSARNLGPECEHHHVVKHGTLWRLEEDPRSRRLRWISPTGAQADLDPPPF